VHLCNGCISKGAQDQRKKLDRPLQEKLERHEEIAGRSFLEPYGSKRHVQTESLCKSDQATFASTDSEDWNHCSDSVFVVDGPRQDLQ